MPKSVPNTWRSTSRISPAPTGASSGCWLCRFQAMTRYQPSPNGTISANASPVVSVVMVWAGSSASGTSASITDRTTAWPGNGSPRPCRTVLCSPSAPTT